MLITGRDVQARGRPKWTPRPWAWVGHRGRFLIAVGIAYQAQAASALDEWGLAPHDLAPGWARAALWALAGLLAIVTAFRPPGCSDRVGWLALYVPPAAWAASYLISFIVWATPGLTAPGVGEGYGGGLVYAAVWGLVVVAILTCADWPEPPQLADAVAQADAEIRGQTRPGE